MAAAASSAPSATGPLANRYFAFMRCPTVDVLAENAVLHYVNSTQTPLDGATTIVRHLEAQGRMLEKKDDRPLNSIEDDSHAFIETETTLAFRHVGGGAYLPRIDAHLLDERRVTFPLMHVVTWNVDGKIASIRLQWDQGSLLKQVEAIGKTGRNWPIEDGVTLIQSIRACLAGKGNTAVSATEDDSGRTIPTGVSAAVRGEKANLDLFRTLDPNEGAASSSYNGPVIAPRESARPARRGLEDIVGETDISSTEHQRSSSILKGGAGKHVVHNRLFDEEDVEKSVPTPGGERLRSPERKKTYEEKYKHFAFGDGEDATTSSVPPTSKKQNPNAPTFDFADFAAPISSKNKNSSEQERKIYKTAGDGMGGRKAV
ncbi:hypothetical protein K470DRAFT_273104 [Piedraia hortae CBS 480.64]|uniref:Uncharacterized protein n=1 Tax=Piedraia hortae CBS 480.64 TaxID=1314780 RepID=A0A6A7BSD8_9PEZI|nr:hypothetical protein K470DRAFT_273104 [Piedraia hortae CBS 480.64]